MDNRLLDVLVCPKDLHALRVIVRDLQCELCGARYAVVDAVIHFVHDDDRPENSKALAQSVDLHEATLYERNAENKLRDYESNPAVRDFVHRVESAGEVIVDLATGPGGGFVVPIRHDLSEVGLSRLVIGKVACAALVQFQSALFRDRYGDAFIMLDVDLGRTLPFASDSIAAFTGTAITNIHAVAMTIAEVVRCLKPGGLVAIGERFYAEGSLTAQYLSDRGHMFATLRSFQDSVTELGLELEDSVPIMRKKGKSDPRDGLPLDEEDEWVWTHLFLRKHDNNNI